MIKTDLLFFLIQKNWGTAVGATDGAGAAAAPVGLSLGVSHVPTDGRRANFTGASSTSTWKAKEPQRLGIETKLNKITVFIETSHCDLDIM